MWKVYGLTICLGAGVSLWAVTGNRPYRDNHWERRRPACPIGAAVMPNLFRHLPHAYIPQHPPITATVLSLRTLAEGVAIPSLPHSTFYGTDILSNYPQQLPPPPTRHAELACPEFISGSQYLLTILGSC
jgi:hypothetical protein